MLTSVLIPAGATPVGAAPAADGPLLAHWTFDEPSGPTCRDATGGGFDATLATKEMKLGRWPGPCGLAAEFSGRHLLRCAALPQPTTMEQIALSAWVLPVELTGYREIYRKEDGDRRLLFSFQESGRVLSLGLNIGGYVECDAAIDPLAVLDGQWHHCAATFDGNWMRVYLDGREVGRLNRPGVIELGGPAPGCIGSSNGGECFQGLLDDLRIYRTSLTAPEITKLYTAGAMAIARLGDDTSGGPAVAAIRKQFKAVNDQVKALCPPAATLPEAVAGCRRAIAVQRPNMKDKVGAAVLARLRGVAPDEFDALKSYLSTGVAEFLAGPVDAPQREAQRLVDLLVEYRPLTAQQWERQSADDRQHWAQCDTWRQRYEDLAGRDPAAGDAAWVEFLLAVGPQIQFRPVVQEAVAPYVPPATPPLIDLSADEAQEALRRDWLHQADGKPTPQRIGQEIEWTRQLAERLKALPGKRVDFTAALAKLDDLQRRVERLTADDAELYCAVRQVKRDIVLANPAITFDKLVFVDGPFPQGKEWQHETRHRLGYMAVPGGRLLVLSGLRPDGHVTQLAPQAPLHGAFWRPDVSFDARRVLFCFKPHNEKAFHLYEVNADGSGLVQLTDGPFDDLDPIYLPDEQHLLFSTTRSHTYVRCMPPTNAFVLARCDRDGRNVYLVSTNNEPDYLPSLMHDGRVVYTRWEYTDKPLWRAQKLWSMNPDGTQVNTLWGNQSVWPDVVKDARAIPGSGRIMMTGSAHHNWFAGAVGIIDPRQGLNFPAGLTKVTGDVVWPECGNGPVDPIESPRYHRSGDYPAYYSPYPLSAEDFLVSARRGGKFLLYLMDVDGNRELIYEGIHNIFYAQPLAPRQRPPVLLDRVAWPDRQRREKPREGVIYSNNVYQGAPPQLAGQAKFLRVMQIDPKTYTYWHKRPYISTGPVVSMVQSEGVKRIIGTVPIEADGSVSFHAPPGVSLHFQLLDADGRALQTMRSFAGVMPGEYRGCLGCHESHSRSPLSTATSLALSRPPRDITPPPWEDTSVSYARYVQPVMNQYCVRCHTGDAEGRKAFDLTDRAGFLGFSEPYITMIGRPSWGQPYKPPEKPVGGWGIAGMLMIEAYGKIDPAAYQTPAPMTALSYRSRLVELAGSGKHYDVKVDPISLQRLIVWVDAMCPYRGDEEVREIDDPDFQGVDWLAIRPKIKTAPNIVRPGPVD